MGVFSKSIQILRSEYKDCRRSCCAAERVLIEGCDETVKK